MKQYGSPLEQSIDIAHALLVRKLRGPWRTLENIDEEEERADLSLHIVERFGYYDPAKGAVSTWTYKVFAQWAYERVQERKARWAVERIFPTVAEGDEPTVWDFMHDVEHAGTPAEFSAEAERLIALFPERTRDAVRLCLGDGLNNPMAADHLGVSRRTVWRRMREALDHIPAIRTELELAV